jgi:pyruvate/2-oxoglutarate/acetoin dehydrogenase E1 component
VIDNPIAELGFTTLQWDLLMQPIVNTWPSILFSDWQIINNAAKMRQMTGGQFNAYRFQQLQQDN